MNNPEAVIEHAIEKAITIHAPAAKVWETLTDPERMALWVYDTPVSITSAWRVGSPITFWGDLHGIEYENKGTILQFVPGKILQYTFWSTLSQHADVPENYSVITFKLASTQNETVLTFIQTNFATETIYQHFYFYWNTTLQLIKKISER